MLAEGNGCSQNEAGVDLHGRSSPVLDRLQVHLSALMTSRVAAGSLEHLLPVDAGSSHQTFR